MCLVEKSDFASGTSSKSTKLIHGGLRYLEQFKFSLIRETGKERAILHNLAPHIVKSEKMLLPITKGGKLGKISTFFVRRALSAITFRPIFRPPPLFSHIVPHLSLPEIGEYTRVVFGNKKVRFHF